MPTIYDNINSPLDLALQATLAQSRRADFCVGYFNLRGWRRVADYIEDWTGEANNCCRLLVGMQQQPENLLREYYTPGEEEEIDNRRAADIRKKLAQNFRQQLTIGVPTAEDEKYLKQLQQQLREKKVVVKLFLRHPLHAKLYLLFRDDFANPVTGYLGSSNLTLSGLARQGELNIDVMDKDATQKLAKWFEDRWKERYCVDISEELIQVLDESWVRDKLPYHIYLKIAYHLSADARAGAAGYQLPAPFDKKLLSFQQSAVQMAARHLDKRGGVLIGDVVGLGKTITAAALVKMFEQRDMTSTLIICPKNLVSMWQGYINKYDLKANVMSITQVQTRLDLRKELRFYSLVVVDESHNLRNREGKRYRVLHEYLQRIGSRVILLSATPYNKTYLDLSNQLRLFVPEDLDLGLSPEQFIRGMGGIAEFGAKYQYSARTLAAFEKSEDPDDWRELMKMFMVRRTRSFIKSAYTTLDPEKNRHYLTFEDGTRAYFPDRHSRKVEFGFSPDDPADQYARLYDEEVVSVLNNLCLPRYGLGQYLSPAAVFKPTTKEEERLRLLLDGLSRAGKRLKGFCRTNLFKRLESSGYAFLLSLSRHVLRNYVFLYALEHGLPLPIGQQEAALLDSRLDDEDPDDLFATSTEDEENEEDDTQPTENPAGATLRWNFTEEEYQLKAAAIYKQFAKALKRRFRWMDGVYFAPRLAVELRQDAAQLQRVLDMGRDWKASQDRKLNALEVLCQQTHPNEKVLIFTQFADTACYLADTLKARGVRQMVGVTGSDANPTSYAHRFSPRSNELAGVAGTTEELRILVGTDVLSEGQNLQDAHIVVNYDLPWAIIRLIQRAGRVDRIGQQALDVLCYSFLPEAGIEKVIALRSRLVQRLQENAEVVGTDEVFMDEDVTGATGETLLRNLYNERNGILDCDGGDGEVDLASQAYYIWKTASDADPTLHKIIPDLAPVSHATQATHGPDGLQPGVLLYARTANDNDLLVWVDREGQLISQSQSLILRAAACAADTPALPRQENHHELVRHALDFAHDSESSTGGQLGPKSSARYQTYHRLNRYHDSMRELPLFNSETLKRTIDEVFRFPLRTAARDGLNRLLKTGADDAQLAQYAIALYEEGLLGLVAEGDETEPGRREPQILCSMGLV